MNFALISKESRKKFRGLNLFHTIKKKRKEKPYSFYIVRVCTNCYGQIKYNEFENVRVRDLSQIDYNGAFSDARYT